MSWTGSGSVSRKSRCFYGVIAEEVPGAGWGAGSTPVAFDSRANGLACLWKSMSV